MSVTTAVAEASGQLWNGTGSINKSEGQLFLACDPVPSISFIEICFWKAQAQVMAAIKRIRYLIP
jgi:hypothetical protein